MAPLKSLWNLPVRIKVIFLVSGSLVLSLGIYLIVSRSLLVADKLSYLYDYNLTKIQNAGNFIESRIEGASEVAVLLAKHPGLGPNSEDIDQIVKSSEKKYSVSAFYLLIPDFKTNSWSSFRQIGAQNEEKINKTKLIIQKMGFLPKDLLSVSQIIRTPRFNQVWSISRHQTLKGTPVAIVSVLPLFVESDSDAKDWTLFALSPSGQILGTTGLEADKVEALSKNESSDLAKTIFSPQFPSGVQEHTLLNTEYLLGYRHVQHRSLSLVSLVPKSAAFSAARAMSKRVFGLGISILMVAVGVTLLFIRSLTDRLKELWSATLKVSEGDFSVRVNETGGKRDELASLAKSFNSMSGKIMELLQATAQKARMEKELETAQAVQSMFFPNVGIVEGPVELSGQYLPASECAGDWWHYTKQGNHILVVIGDVTGHGVSSALITAAVHGSFSIAARRLGLAFANSEKEEKRLIEDLMTHLNAIVHSVSGGKFSMTLFASLINTTNGTVVYSNAAHVPTYVFRKSNDGKNNYSAIPLMGGQSTALGLSLEYKPETEVAELMPSDWVFWYTDGLTEIGNVAGIRFSKVKFLKNTGLSLQKLAATLINSQRGLPPTIQACEAAIQASLESVPKEVAHHRPDDITVVFASISKDAAFQSQKTSIEQKNSQSTPRVA